MIAIKSTTKTKGFISVSLLAILIVTSIVIFASYGPIVNSSFRVKRGEEKLYERLEERNAIERMQGKLKQTPAFVGTLQFPDLGMVANFKAPKSLISTARTATESGYKASLKILQPGDGRKVLEVDFVPQGSNLVKGNSLYSFNVLINGTTMTIPTELKTNIVGKVQIDVSQLNFPTGTYTLEVTSGKPATIKRFTFEATMKNIRILELSKDGQILKTIYYDK